MMRSSAAISADQKYRYALVRHWGSDLDWTHACTNEPRAPRVVWVMLNPSVADDEIDDPTIRKCIGFSRRWGYESMFVINLFALRATYPEELKRATDPFGPSNPTHIAFALKHAKTYGDLVVFAWGNHGKLFSASEELKRVLRRHDLYPLYAPPMCLGLTRSGQPKHPLMLPYRTELETFRF